MPHDGPCVSYMSLGQPPSLGGWINCLFPSPQLNSGKSKNTYFPESMFKQHSNNRHIPLILWARTADMPKEVEHFTESVVQIRAGSCQVFWFEKSLQEDGLTYSTHSMQPVETLGYSAKNVLKFNFAKILRRSLQLLSVQRQFLSKPLNYYTSEYWSCVFFL